MFDCSASALRSVWEWHAPPGAWIAILALFGVLVPLLRKDIGPREKALWTIVMFLLVWFEIRSLNQESQRQQQQFQTIANGLTDAIQKSQQQFDVTVSRINQNISAVTGGDSFCYFVFTRNGVPTIVHVGNYTLYDLTARFENVDAPIDFSAVALKRDTFSAGNLPPNTVQPMLGSTIAASSPDKHDLNIFFEARNGFWTEEYHAVLVNGRWVDAIRIFRQILPPHQKDIKIFERVDKDFPRRSDGSIDWTIRPHQ
jgi:hypothetical protein